MLINKPCICNIEPGDEKLIARGRWIDLYVSRDRRGEFYVRAVSSDGRVDIKTNCCPGCCKKLEEDE